MSSCDGISDALSSVFEAKRDQLSMQIGIAVERKSLDATKVQGEAAVQLIEAAAQIARQLGQGVNFDALA